METIATSQKITPFLWFNDNLEEAVNFYVSVFKTASITQLSYLPGDAPGTKGKVLTARFNLNGLDFMALNGGPQFMFTEAISFFVHCQTQQEVDDLWDKFIAGGGQAMQCGWLKDKYGISWQIIPDILGQLMADADPVKAKRVMDAMLQMVKINIAGLRRAYDGP